MGFLGGLIGAVIGFFTGGPVGALYGFFTGYYIGSIIAGPQQAQTQSNVGSPAVNDKEINTCEVGTPIPLCLGTVKLNANILWTGREFAIMQYASEGNPTGWDYHAYWAIGICEGPLDYYHTIYKGSDPSWSETLNIDDAANGYIYRHQLGFAGIHFYFGTNDQESNSLIGSDMTAEQAPYNIPYRNMAWMAFLDGFVGNYGYIYPSIYVVASRFPDCTFDPSNLYKIVGDYDYNFAHCLWFLLKRAGIPNKMLNAENFLEKAAILYSEGLGGSIKIESGDDDYLTVITSIYNHIRGALRFDQTGRICLELIRDDYDEDTLPEITEDMFVEDPVFSKETYLGTFNAVGVQFTERLGTITENYIMGQGNGINFALGQGFGDTSDKYDMVDILDVSGNLVFPKVSSGIQYNPMIIMKNKLYGWGSNDSGALGQGATTYIYTPTLLNEEGSWLQLYIGYLNAFAKKADGWYCWGYNAHGELGLGDKTNRTTYTAFLDSFTDLAISWNTLVVKSGELWVTGWNEYGVIGNGTWKDGDHLVFEQIGSENNWSKVYLSSHSAMAINESNEIYSWGYEQNGNMGQGTSLQPYFTPTLISSAPSKTWKKVAIGNSASLFLSTDGVLYGVGAKELLGIGVTVGDQYTFLQLDTDVDDIGAGGFGWFVKVKDGLLYGTGYNNQGQLGVNPTTQNYYSTWVQITDLVDWVQIMCLYDTIIGSKS